MIKSRGRFVKNKGCDKIYMYTYKIVKEDLNTGKQNSKIRTITKNHPLTIGGLYFHLGQGLKGCWRVLELIEVLEL